MRLRSTNCSGLDTGMFGFIETVSAIVGSFKACKQLADFDSADAAKKKNEHEAPDIAKSIVKYEDQIGI